MRLLRGDVALIGVPGEVRQEHDGRVVLEQDPPAVLLLRSDDVVEQHAVVLVDIPPAGGGLGLDRLEDEVGRVDLPVRMRVRHADHVAFVLEDEHVIDLGMRAQLEILIAPRAKQRRDLVHRQLRQRQVVAWRVADDARDAGRGRVPVDARRRLELTGSVGADARQIVVKNED